MESLGHTESTGATAVTDCLKFEEMQLWWWWRSHLLNFIFKEKKHQTFKEAEKMKTSPAERREGGRVKENVSDCSIAAQRSTELLLYPA